MASVSDNLTITSVQTRKAILKAFKVKRPLFLWGPPGIGKSEVVQEVADELGGHRSLPLVQSDQHQSVDGVVCQI